MLFYIRFIFISLHIRGNFIYLAIILVKRKASGFVEDQSPIAIISGKQKSVLKLKRQHKKQLLHKDSLV